MIESDRVLEGKIIDFTSISLSKESSLSSFLPIQGVCVGQRDEGKVHDFPSQHHFCVSL